MSVIWNGLQVGGPEPVSPLRKVTAIPEGDPGAVAAIGPRVGQDGVWRTTAYRNGLTGPLEGVMTAHSVPEVEALKLALKAAASVNIAPLTISGPAGTRTLFIGRDADLEIAATGPLSFAWATRVIAPDPTWWWGGQTADGRLDDTYAQVFEIGLPDSSGGLTFPVAFPVVFADEGDTGDLLVQVDGSARMSWRIDGPVVNPSVSVANADGIRVVAWRLTLVGGEWLHVDPDTHRSLLQGEASRTPWRRQWPQLRPGENAIRLRADAYDPAARLTVVVRPIA